MSTGDLPVLFATAPVRPTLVGIVALLTSVTLHAAIQQAAPELPAAYSGTWKDTDIGMIAVHPSGNALEVWGTDRASIYRTVCIVDPKDSTVATCAGDGFNHLERLRFSYRSRFKLDAAAHGGPDHRRLGSPAGHRHRARAGGLQAASAARQPLMHRARQGI